MVAAGVGMKTSFKASCGCVAGGDKDRSGLMLLVLTLHSCNMYFLTCADTRHRAVIGQWEVCVLLQTPFF